MVPLVSRLRPADAGELAAAAAQFGEVVDEAEASQEVLHKANSLQGLAFALAYQGELSAARAAADAALEAAELGEYFAGMGYSALTTAALAAGDVQTAQHASEAAWRNLSLALPLSAAVQRAFNAQAALAGGDLSAARRWCDDAVQSMTGHHLAMALATRARIAVAEGKREEAERDAHKALACAAESGAHLDLPDVLECLAGLASDAGTHHAAARLFGAAEAIRQQIGSVRFAIYRSDYVQSVTALRDAMGRKTSTLHGPKVPRCRSRRRSPMRNVATPGANDRPPVGNRLLRPRLTSCDWLARDWPTRTSRRGFSSHREQCKRT